MMRITSSRPVVVPRPMRRSLSWFLCMGENMRTDACEKINATSVLLMQSIHIICHLCERLCSVRIHYQTSLQCTLISFRLVSLPSFGASSDQWERLVKSVTNPCRKGVWAKHGLEVNITWLFELFLILISLYFRCFEHLNFVS